MSTISLFEEKQVTEQILRLIQSVPSPKAEPFKRWLAKVGYERPEEIEKPELASRSVGILPTFNYITSCPSPRNIAHDRAYSRFPHKIGKLPKPEAASPAAPAANSNPKAARKSLPNQTSNRSLPQNRNHRSSHAKTTSHNIILKVSSDYALFSRPS